MEIKIEIETLRKNKLFIATPMYGVYKHTEIVNDCWAVLQEQFEFLR